MLRFAGAMRGARQQESILKHNLKALSLPAVYLAAHAPASFLPVGAEPEAPGEKPCTRKESPT